MPCLNCGKPPRRRIYKYCSNKCQRRFEFLEFIEVWKDASSREKNIIFETNISHHLRNYLIDKFSNACSVCGWNTRHPVTGAVPLAVDHIDGDASNNIESNLRILCPNCHSLTPNFRNLNKGKGRIGRKGILGLMQIG